MSLCIRCYCVWVSLSVSTGQCWNFWFNVKKNSYEKKNECLVLNTCSVLDSIFFYFFSLWSNNGINNWALNYLFPDCNHKHFRGYIKVHQSSTIYGHWAKYEHPCRFFQPTNSLLTFWISNPLTTSQHIKNVSGLIPVNISKKQNKNFISVWLVCRCCLWSCEYLWCISLAS